MKSPVDGHDRKSLQDALTPLRNSETEAAINTIVTGIFGNGCRDCWQSSDGFVTTLIWPCRRHRVLRPQSFLWFFAWASAGGLMLAAVFIGLMVWTRQ